MQHRCSTTLAAVVILTTALSLPAQEPNFGRAMAMTTSELLVGQPVNWYGPGVVYSYQRDASGAWREGARLTASDSARMDDFGRAIATEGNVLVVGAPRKRNGAGVAYIFERSRAGSPWRQTAIMTAPDSGLFATALVLSGDDLVIGTPGATGGGVVHHFRRSGREWRLTATVRPIDGTGLSAFGASLSLQGRRLLIGAPTSDGNAGRVYLSHQDSGGVWSAPDAITLPRNAMTGAARAGSAVLLAGDRGFVGAPGAGVVHQLVPVGRGFSVGGELHPFDPTRGSEFGHAIAMVGPSLWVGAPGAVRGNGQVYRFLPGTNGEWVGSARLDADSATGTAWPFAFGYAMAAAGGRAVIGMPSRDFGEGRVLALAPTAGTWQPSQQLQGQIYTIGGGPAPASRCEKGKIGEFTCSNIELMSHLPMSALGGERGAWVNDVWGWTDPTTQRDYALVARRDGTSFVDLTDPARPRLVGNLPRTEGSPPSVWRDIKVMHDHAYIVADGAGAHGVQVFDLARLRRVGSTPAEFRPDTTYREIASAHNVVVDSASGFLYVVGSNSGGETCGGGLHMVDARTPTQLRFVGCYNDRAGANTRGYTHDAQCLTYRGPDVKHRGRQICVGSNEKEINIADVTDKTRPVVIGRNSYPNVSYAHQGWFDDEQRYFYMNDEGDELDGLVAGTRTIVWDLSDLSDPIVANMYIGPVRSSDHNLFVKGDRVFEANYGSGLRVLDIKDRVNPREIGFFDSAPYNDDGPGYSASESGAWSNYPFFKNGIVIFTSVREGLFIVRVMGGAPIS